MYFNLIMDKDFHLPNPRNIDSVHEISHHLVLIKF